MLRTLLTDQVWFGLLVVTILYVLDYQLSVLGIRWFRRGADAHYDLGGSYELNPPFEDDIERERLVSPRHLLALLRIWIVIGVAWWLTRVIWDYPDVYVAVVGFFVLTQMPVLLRHAQNLVLFRFVSLRGGVEGRTNVERWLEQKMSGVVFWYFAGAYVVLWLLLGDPFFIGGALGTALAGARFWIFGGEAQADSEDADPGVVASGNGD